MTVQLCWDGNTFTRRYIVDWKVINIFSLNDGDADVIAFGEMLKRRPGEWYTVPDLMRKS